MSLTIKIAVVTVFVATFVFGQSPTIDSFKLRTIRYKLSNGMTVVLQPDASQNEASVEFWIHSGTSDEPAGKFGFAHFFEHATPFGKEARPGLQADLSKLKTDSNAQTRKDYTRYFVQVRPAGVELALLAAAARMKADPKTVTDRLIEFHKRNVLAEFDRQESSPFWGPSVSGAREAGVFGANGLYGHGAYGTRSANEAFTADEVAKWYGNVFKANDTTLFVIGNFDAIKVSEIIQSNFLDVPSGRISRQTKPAFSATEN